MNITKATILVGRGADKVMLDTDLPCATWPYEGKQHLTFDVAAGNGAFYVSQHFPDVKVKVVSV